MGYARRMSRHSLGIPGATPLAAVEELAAATEKAGLHALWLNVTPGADVLAKTAAAIAATRRLHVGLGVIPVDQQEPVAIAAEANRLDLPADRVTLGIGAGREPRPVPLLRSAIGTLRARTDIPIAVGALGPRARQLAAELADGLVFNWVTPRIAAVCAADAERDAARADRPTPHRIVYVRTVVDPAALPSLIAEAERYEAYPSYAAAFSRNGHRAIEAALQVTDARHLGERVQGYSSMDEIVFRAIGPDDSVGSILHVLDVVAALTSVSARPD